MIDLPRYVSDTHAILWHLDDNRRLSELARSHFDSADEGKTWLYVSVITLIEMVYLADRGRLDPTITERVLTMLATPNGSYAPVKVDLDIARML